MLRIPAGQHKCSFYALCWDLEQSTEVNVKEVIGDCNSSMEGDEQGFSVSELNCMFKMNIFCIFKISSGDSNVAR